MALTKAKFGVISSALASGNATDGYVLTADGSGNSAWEEVAGGPTFKTFGTSSIMIGDNATGTIDAADYNTGVGVDVFAALTSGDENTAIGFEALNDNTTGNKNTAVGFRALDLNTTASENTAIGGDALGNTTTGGNNVAVGRLALSQNTTGVSHTAVGHQALDACTTGNNNTAFGKDALGACTTGGHNVACGLNALAAQTTSNNCTAVGSGAGIAITTSDKSAVFGREAGVAITTGVNNVMLGGSAGYNTTTGDNNVVIGTSASCANSTDYRCLFISTVGGSGKGSHTGFLSAGGSASIYQGNNSASWATTSDKRIKKNIVENIDGLNKIEQIQVKNFEYRTEDEITDFDNPKAVAVEKQGVQLGVIAQEIQEILPDVVKEEDTGCLRVDPDNITWYLVNAVKELSAEVKQLKQKLGE